MLSDAYVGLIIGFILTLTTSVISIFLTHHYAEKEWARKTSREEQRQVVEQVYSPLFFIFTDLPFQLAYIAGVLSGFSNKGLRKKVVKAAFLDWVEAYKKEEKASLLIASILKTKSGAINPKEFWKDLFSYSNYLRKLERELERFHEFDFTEEKISNLEKRFQNIGKSTAIFFELASELRSFLEMLILEEGKLPEKVKYKPIMSDAIKERLNILVTEPIDKEIQKQVEDMFSRVFSETVSMDEST